MRVIITYCAAHRVAFLVGADQETVIRFVSVDSVDLADVHHLASLDAWSRQTHSRHSGCHQAAGLPQ